METVNINCSTVRGGERGKNRREVERVRTNAAGIVQHRHDPTAVFNVCGYIRIVVRQISGHRGCMGGHQPLRTARYLCGVNDNTATTGRLTRRGQSEQLACVVQRDLYTSSKHNNTTTQQVPPQKRQHAEIYMNMPKKQKHT